MKKIVFLFFCLLVSVASAVVRPASIFTDNMILQRDEPVRIWGTAEPNEEVTVRFAGQEKVAVTDSSNHWKITLDPMPASSQPRKMTILSDSNTPILQYSNLLVGEVWLAGGQSNMATKMEHYSRTTRPDMEAAQDALLRMVTIPPKAFDGPATGENPVWKQTNPQTVRGFSATAYYFARDLREVLDVPVGIIVCAVGGTPAESWMSRETLSSDPQMNRVLENYEKIFRLKFPTDDAYTHYMEEEYPRQIREYQDKNKQGIKPNPKPSFAMGPRNAQRPCGLYEGMLTQAIPCTIRGVIWYQGENNANTLAGWHYRQVFTALINQWRSDFRNPELPFLFAQLATYGLPQDLGPYWAELRESQRLVELDVPHTGMAVLVDGGEQKDIHPHSKPKIGRRLALLARNMVYGEKDLICRGPRLDKKKSHRGNIELSFSDVGSGLVLKPEPVSAFEICGADGAFVPARAELNGNTITLSSPEITSPCDVRYGWKKWFAPTLYNQDGLPASPFRTDDQPMASHGNVYFDATLAQMKK
jgi:sialate O-acetylesterase